MQYKKGKPAYTSQTPKNQPSNQYRQWLRQTQPDTETLKNPHKINDQLASHQSSIIYEHIRNMSIEDDLPPALLDISLQKDNQNTEIVGQNLRSSRDSVSNKRKDKKYLKSIYIQQQQIENTYQAKNNNASNSGVQENLNNKTNKQIASIESSLNFYDGINLKTNNNRTNNMNIKNGKRLQQIQRVDEQQNIAITTFNIYSALIEQPRFVSLNNSTTTIKTTNKTVTSTALQQPSQLYTKQPKQELASILLNNNKLLSYVQRLTELQINKHNQVSQIYHKNSKIMDYKKQDNAQIQNQVRVQKSKAEILGMLACLMIKIRQGSQRCNGLLPEIIKNKQGQITFNFGAPKNTNSIHNLTKYSSKKQQLSSQTNKSQKVINLNKKLAQQDSLLQKIKQEYDTIINNYMTTIASLMMENKQKQERFSKSEDNQKSKNIQTKNIDKYSSDEKDKSSSDLMRGDSKVSEIIKSHQIIDKDEQLERLILSSNKMDTLDVFNRLSADSKRKSKSRIGEVQKLQFSFQKQ